VIAAKLCFLQADNTLKQTSGFNGVIFSGVMSRNIISVSSSGGAAEEGNRQRQQGATGVEMLRTVKSFFELNAFLKCGDLKVDVSRG
jgi:hypothetical protein